jgi:hypothetical protein
LENADFSLVNELDVIAILVELRDVPVASCNLLLRKQNVRHRDGAEPCFPDEVDRVSALTSTSQMASRQAA